MVLGANPLIEVIPGLMVWTIVAFLFCLFILKRYAFKPVQKAIDDRRDHIRESINAADQAREDAKKLLEEHRQLIRDAKVEADGILADTRKIAAAQQEKMREDTEEDRQRRLEETQRQIEQSTQQAIGQIRDEVSDLSLLAAEKVTGKSLSDDDAKRLIDEAIGELDFSQLEASQS